MKVLRNRAWEVLGKIRVVGATRTKTLERIRFLPR